MDNIARYCISETRLILRGCKDKYCKDKGKMFPQLVEKIPVTTNLKNTESRITFQIKTGIILNC